MHQCFKVESQQSCRQSADRAEHTETPADVRRNREGRIVFLPGDREEITLRRIGNDDESFARFGFAKSIVHPFPHDGECRHRFRRHAGFRDDVDDSILR